MVPNPTNPRFAIVQVLSPKQTQSGAAKFNCRDAYKCHGGHKYLRTSNPNRVQSSYPIPKFLPNPSYYFTLHTKGPTLGFHLDSLCRKPLGLLRPRKGGLKCALISPRKKLSQYWALASPFFSAPCRLLRSQPRAVFWAA